MKLLEVCDLRKNYYIENSRTMKREKIEVIKNISFQIAESESVSIMGKSGCGKTTLLNMLGGLINPSSGSIFYKGENLSDLRNILKNIGDCRWDLYFKIIGYWSV